MNHFSEKVSLIWNVADQLRGDYKQSEYGRVILPFLVLRRLDQVIAPPARRCGRPIRNSPPGRPPRRCASECYRRPPYSSSKKPGEDDEWVHQTITLSPDSNLPEYQPIELRGDSGVQIVAQLVQVLGG